MKYGTIAFVTIFACLMSVAFASDLPAPLAADAEFAARAESDPRVRQYIMPNRIVWQSEGETIEDAEALLNPTSGQASVHPIDVSFLGALPVDRPHVPRADLRGHLGVQLGLLLGGERLWAANVYRTVVGGVEAVDVGAAAGAPNPLIGRE